MYRPKSYVVDDVAVLHAAIRARRFATIAGIVDGTVQFAYAPVLLDMGPRPRGRLRFHVARASPLAEIDGALLHFSFLGPDAYLSPDWYQTQALMPTWNYVAIEAGGQARALDEKALRQLLSDLSAQEEERLAPKRPWTPDKVPEERIAMLLEAIRGFEVTLDSLEGKFKLSQTRTRPISLAQSRVSKHAAIPRVLPWLARCARRANPAHKSSPVAKHKYYCALTFT